MTLDQIAAQLKPVMLDALTRTQPHCNLGTGSGLLFTGNYDWHSSVHAHWALLSMARLTDDEPLRDEMLARLSPANLAAEAEFLARDEQFELPYGRAWLALLLSELEKHPHGYTELPRLRALVESQVISWLELTPLDASQIACGSHQSWLFAYLLLQLSAPAPPLQTRLDALFARIDAARAGIARAPHTDTDFLYLPAVLRVIDQTRALPDASKYRHSTRPRWRAPNPSNCHTAGANVTRLWPRAFEGRYARALPSVLKRTPQWKNDFYLVGHWVPQFIWLGALLERGEFAATAPL